MGLLYFVVGFVVGIVVGGLGMFFYLSFIKK
jgi:uncharacterized membrane-anchored protein YhcB (DUF1043 family)